MTGCSPGPTSTGCRDAPNCRRNSRGTNNSNARKTPCATASTRASKESRPPTVPPTRPRSALAAAAIEYHRREDKSYWWEHFNRHIAPVEQWADQRDVFVVHFAEVATDWQREPGKRTDSRVVRLRGIARGG